MFSPENYIPQECDMFFTPVSFSPPFSWNNQKSQSHQISDTGSVQPWAGTESQEVKKTKLPAKIIDLVHGRKLIPFRIPATFHLVRFG